MVGGPYRSTKIRGGVALPRRAEAWWQLAVGLAAFTWLLVIGSLATTELREEVSVVRDRLGWFFVLGAGVLMVVGPLASAIAMGRSTRTTPALAIALAPAVFAELWGATRFPAWKLRSIADLPHVVGTDTVLDVASARVGCHAVTSVAALVVAIACLGFVLGVQHESARASGVRSESARASLVASILVVCATLCFAALRLRDWHRDGFVGALPVFGMVAAAVLAPLLRGRVRALADWHDDEERRAVRQAAWIALVAIAVATLAAERALLAYEESRGLTALQRWAYSYDTRYELVHALVGSIRAHHIALAIIAGTFVALLASAARDLAPRRWAAWSILPMFVAIVGLAAWSEHRVSTALVEPPGPVVPVGVELPGVEHEPTDASARPSTFLSLVPQREPAERPRAFVVDRRAPTRELFAVTHDWSGDWLGIVATGGPAPKGLGPRLALIGPRWSIVEFDVGSFSRMKSGRGLVVLEEAGTARLRVLGGQVFGMSLSKELDARRHRLQLGAALGTFASVLVAPAPNGDIQSLVDLLAAVQDVVRTRVILTSDYDDVADKIRTE